ncbi:MAG TPA: sigma-54-dependent Fis family transcriptional regulator [Candidatus Marinimicrobia bacterium]|mgnify:CR=1 FL=1|nr:sigma-54-dependent Fis family transcriptional regulator [Candidatus Neomarinimicrobiota bacterium]
MSYTILVVDDNRDTRENIRELLDDNGYQSIGAGNGKVALEMIESKSPDGIILDMNLPEMNGWRLIRRIKDRIAHGLLVIIITAYGDIQMAVDAIKVGVYDFFEKPFNNDKLLISLKNGLEKFEIQKELNTLKSKGLSKIVTADDFGLSRIIKKVLDDARKVARTNFSVLIEGPTGSGKNLLARYIHQQSDRRKGPFINVDCGTISGTLIESELFGHVKGSFTNAYCTKEGKFVAAHGGTLVLDEIGNIPLEQQVKFLRAVEDKKITPIGSNQEYDVDFRLIVATLENLEKLIAAGKFRQDLYYRIAEFTIKVPALVDRQEDILYLAQRFIRHSNHNLNKQVSTEINESVSEKLLSHTWHGNVRELQHVISTAVLLSKNEISSEYIIFRNPSNHNFGITDPLKIPYQKGIALKEDMISNLERMERLYLLKALELADHNKSKAAEIFGIDRKNFYLKLAKYNLN